MVCSLGVVFPTVALGGDFTYRFDSVFGGIAPASATQPWVEATFQTVTAGHVSLRISNLNLTGAEALDQIYFNINPALAARQLKFKTLSSSGGFDLPKFMTGEDRLKAGGDGRYDLEFSFAQRGTAVNRFDAGEYFCAEIFGIPTLRAEDFAYLSTSASATGPLYAAAHVQRTEGGNSGGWLYPSGGVLPVPEPGPAVLLLAASLFALSRRRKVMF